MINQDDKQEIDIKKVKKDKNISKIFAGRICFLLAIESALLYSLSFQPIDVVILVLLNNLFLIVLTIMIYKSIQ